MNVMNVGILGSGDVARTLASGFLKHGHAVMLGTREPARLRDWHQQHPPALVGSMADAAAFGELLVLAVKGTAALAALQGLPPATLKGKTVIDATNPIADTPPVNGVLSFFTDINHALMETLQDQFPDAHFVKAFNSVGHTAMVDPSFVDGRPTMFIAGNDAAAKATVAAIAAQFGWDTADMGGTEAARAIEPLCMLWCIRGFRDGQWTHAFKLLTA